MTKDNFGLNIKKPGYFEALQFIKKMADNKVLDPDWASLKKDDFRAAWKQGKFGIMQSPSFQYIHLRYRGPRPAARLIWKREKVFSDAGLRRHRAAP